MIRHQDLVRELKELVQKLTKERDEASSSNRILLQQQCQTTIQHHEAWLASILSTTEKKESSNESSNSNDTPDEETLKEALQQVRLQLLLQQGDETAHAQVVGATSSILSSSPNQRNIIMRAYALYQLQEYDQVLDLLDTAELKQPYALAAMHLQAQSYYHLQDYEGAMEIYASILEQLEDGGNGDNDNDDDVHEIYVNYMAAYLNQYSLPYCPESKNNKVTRKEDTIFTDLLDVVHKQLQQESNIAEENEDTIFDLRYNVATYQLLHRSNAREAKQFLHSHRAQDKNCHNQLEWSQQFWHHHSNTTSTSMKGMRLQTAETASLKKISNTKDPWLILQYYHDNFDTLDALPQNMNDKIKWTLLQDRLLDYNRCVTFLHREQYGDCRAAVQELWETMAPEKPPEKDDPMLNDPVLLWWEVRLAVLLLYCPESLNSKEKGNTKNKKKTSATSVELRNVRALDFALMTIAESPFRDHMLVYLQLHQAAAEEQFQKQPSLDELYADWPPSLRTKPAVQATMISLKQSDESSDQTQAKRKAPTKETALMQGNLHSNQGNYQSAVECYEMAMTHAKDDDTKQMIQARLVQALTHVDPDRAISLWEEMARSLKTDDNGHGYDLRAMEALEKNTQRWTHAHKVPPSDADMMQSITTADPSRKSHESVLKRRARLRAQYLDQLQKKGLFNPERPTQPDPERWIPKYDRAANRRRKKNNTPTLNKHQGTGAISEKDLAKLDVAAREQQPKTLASNVASTAHLSATGARNKSGKRR
ncbi:hypothetical protein FisN_19Hh019 [Fistulifera solaris]|uniref:Signal recognition particle subunit SRP72 n=1 Tax=Fistulifera solaris TaxID=1519565 RepID=A0A1Z5JZM3_FISSO|nr:hypothetical protein FisN_19Hh019 [Fistulifera solaris]|eukprot:GAX19447.1 hypothetical protein FisN_19Hh019 [Fistulifera solaris]